MKNILSDNLFLQFFCTTKKSATDESNKLKSKGRTRIIKRQHPTYGTIYGVYLGRKK